MSAKRGLAALVVVVLFGIGLAAISGTFGQSGKDAERVAVAAARTNDRSLQNQPPNNPGREGTTTTTWHSLHQNSNNPPTTEAPPTTQTTIPPSTSAPPPTTAPPTTTGPPPPSTTQPTNTTTTKPSQKDGDFDFFMEDGSTDPDTLWWVAPYLRLLSSGAGWTDGDRSGYFCGYAFLTAPGSGAIVGRVTFTAVEVPRPMESYSYISDENMVEGSRYYNGGSAPPGSNELGDCPHPLQAYEPWSGPDQRPTITYGGSGGILETRAYPNVVAHPSIKFRQVEETTTPFVTSGGVSSSTVYSRVTVVAYAKGLPVIVVYYDSLDPSVVMASNL